ncbi:flavin-containing monooxygenase [Mycolicibacillus parakoreensis]|uniref:NAD(P)/FAD-dependent oxidoreductase n=1 Tax=Mycolicibacillus parakoreensis TaxID=1069221 RepID=A0ABY3TUS5_9MYCO|nr:NAD(P)/FAD-dependent oxidoreductase [Mycolicibacillus parakoreensis]ULN51457.1 NAD(P)/FAD-dependent oxidoreductase [Mycolicibacillus parakoreensis]
MSASEGGLPEHVDVVVVGAGLSGVGAGYRLQTECPERSYLILEARGELGGTWDLFRYPGIRSDSDMFTLGYAFKPWRDAKSIADGPAILRYIHETASEFGIDDRIVYGTKVVGADWSSTELRWTLTVQQGDRALSMTCDFVYLCAGYYDYDQAYTPFFPREDDFAGPIVHPQFWPDDLDYVGKRVVIIGSGATAVTLVPSMASASTHVTMLQRSPTWISAVPSRDARADWLRRRLPEGLAHHVVRAKNVVFNIGFYQFCQRLSSRARRLLTDQATRILGDEAMVAEHFTPAYRPWDQRLCAAPGADFFKAIKSGHADVVTDTVAEFVTDGIRLTSGRVLPADIIVTATGLKLRTFGGIGPTIDGEAVEFADEFVWNGAMVSGIPNFAFCVGYTNASGTLRADLSSRLVCRVLNRTRDKRIRAVVPRPTESMAPRPLFGLTSGYVQRSVAEFPNQSTKSPWRTRQNYLLDALALRINNFDSTLRPVTPASRSADGLQVTQTGFSQ